MANVVVKDSHLTYGGVSYFRGGAEEVELGSIGEKRSPLTKMNYLEVKDRLPAKNIGTAKSTKVKIDFSQSSKSAFSTVVSAIIKGVPVKLSGDAIFTKLQSGELDLIKLSVMTGSMKTAANKSTDKLKSLAGWGTNARIVHQVFVVVEASIATQFDGDITVDLSAGVKGLEATAGISSSTKRTTTVSIAAGTTFAYLLAKIDWGKGKDQIDDLNDDQWSLS